MPLRTKRARKLRPNPSMVVALLALFVALTGAASSPGSVMAGDSRVSDPQT